MNEQISEELSEWTIGFTSKGTSKKGTGPKTIDLEVDAEDTTVLSEKQIGHLQRYIVSMNTSE